MIQAAMGSENARLYRFHVGREMIARPGMGGRKWNAMPSIGAGRMRLADLATRGVKRFSYVFDVGAGVILPKRAEVKFPR